MGFIDDAGNTVDFKGFVIGLFQVKIEDIGHAAAATAFNADAQEFFLVKSFGCHESFYCFVGRGAGAPV